MTTQFSLVTTDDGQRFLTLVTPDGPLVTDDTYPKFKDILELCVRGAPTAQIAPLFNVEKAISEKFAQLSERVTVGNGTVFFDGEPQDSVVAKQVVKFLDEDSSDWVPLVAFMENIAQNPSENSRKQLFTWLTAHEFEIDEDGCVIAYKGVKAPLRAGDPYLSTHGGPAIINGVPHKGGPVPQRVNDTISMSRCDVEDNPFASCSRGLHVGTRHYASNFGTVVIEVIVNPRDVVSVPTDGRGEKVRVCRYTIAGGDRDYPS